MSEVPLCEMSTRRKRSWLTALRYRGGTLALSAPLLRHSLGGKAYTAAVFVVVQGYLAHKKQHPPSTLQ